MDGLMQGKRGLIMGVANNRSIAWGIATKLAEQGAEIAFTYQGEGFGARVEKLGKTIGSEIFIDCDVEDLDSVDNVFAVLKEKWGSIDFLVHAIGFSDKDELDGKYANTSRDNFTRTMIISAFSFTEAAKRAAELMTDGGSMITLTYGGSTRVMPNYNVMGVAKAALEASVRYLAVDFGPDNIRVNALSPGPMRTLAGNGISGAREMFKFQQKHSPLERVVSLEDVGGSALYMLSDLSSGITGDVHFVDAGYNITSTPHPDKMGDE